VFTTLQRLLENVVSRIVLSVAIVISLVPHQWLGLDDVWFMVLFGPEVLARTLLAFRRESLPALPGRRLEEGWRAPTSNELWLLLLDFIALVSFLPAVAGSFMSARWLRLFRLSRTVLLLRYWAPMVNDLWTVTRRPERRRQIFFIFGTLLVICFAGAVLLDHVTTDAGDDFDGDGVVGDPHDHEFLVRMWWAFRQVEDPGNLLASPHDTGTLVVSVALTLAGLFVISFIIGMGTDVVTDLSSLGRTRPPGLRGHTVIVHANNSSRRLLRELLHEEFKVLPAATEVTGMRWLTKFWRNLRTSQAFVVVGKDPERPAFLREPEFSRVVYRAWEDGDDDTLVSRGDLLMARRVILLAADCDHMPDDDTIRSSLSVVEQLRDCEDERPRHLLAEIVSQDNLPAAQRAISRSKTPLRTTVVPTEALLARCVAAVCRHQGMAGLLTELLRSEGKEIYGWEEAAGAGPKLASCRGKSPLEALARAGSRGQKAVTPLGVLVGEEGGASRAVLNPRAGSGEVRGVIALADTVYELDALVAAYGDADPSEPALVHELEFEVEAPVALQRILVCGFRPGNVLLLETLLGQAKADAMVHILVADQKTRAQALEAFTARSALLRQGMSAESSGRFLAAGDGLRWESEDVGSRIDIRLTVGDWTSPRSLGDLPGEISNAIDYDLIVFAADGSGESDARNTTALMTVEALAQREPDKARPRVVAEVDDVELAARLNERFVSMQRPEIHVFSTDELRALVMFQSVVVEVFATILEELVCPGPNTLVPLRVGGGSGRLPFAELAESLRATGRILVAVDPRDGSGVRIGGSDAVVDLERARLWVMDC
jgi:hypothetical protein